jgi:hypothetical protein
MICVYVSSVFVLFASWKQQQRTISIDAFGEIGTKYTREKTGARAWSKRARGKCYEPILRLEVRVNGEISHKSQLGRFYLTNQHLVPAKTCVNNTPL